MGEKSVAGKLNAKVLTSKARKQIDIGTQSGQDNSVL